jgi:hypothetical protein
MIPIPATGETGSAADGAVEKSKRTRKDGRTRWLGK